MAVIEIKRFVSDTVTVELQFVEYGDKTDSYDSWTYDCWYNVVAVQNGVKFSKVCETLEDATVAFDELCNGFDTEAELAAQKTAAETWAQLESEVCTDNDYSIEE